jgi:hypothetical protein
MYGVFWWAVAAVHAQLSNLGLMQKLTFPPNAKRIVLGLNGFSCIAPWYALLYYFTLFITPNDFTCQGESPATQRVKSYTSLHYLISKKIYHYPALQYFLDQPQDARLALETPPFDLQLGRTSKGKIEYVITSLLIVYFPNRFDIFLQIANHMRDSNSEPNQVWKWDLQPMWPEALRVLASRLFRLAKSLWNQGKFLHILKKSFVMCQWPQNLHQIWKFIAKSTNIP